MQEHILTLGHSPDPDDAFMFYALAKGLIPTHGFRFEHILQDIQTLNERAIRGELDITAVSIHAYAYVSDQYALLPSGASMGDGYGPLVVARELPLLGCSGLELCGQAVGHLPAQQPGQDEQQVRGQVAKGGRDLLIRRVGIGLLQGGEG